MRNLFRVIPYIGNAKRNDAGNPTYFPENLGVHRVDNLDHYKVAYLANSSECALAEKFGYLSEWRSTLLRPEVSLPRSKWALINYKLDESSKIFEMDDPQNLVKLKVRPSKVVTRDRTITQNWALKVFKTQKNSGVSWWSYYNPDWGCAGIWDLKQLSVYSVEILTLEHPAFKQASIAIGKPLILS